MPPSYQNPAFHIYLLKYIYIVENNLVSTLSQSRYEYFGFSYFSYHKDHNLRNLVNIYIYILNEKKVKIAALKFLIDSNN